MHLNVVECVYLYLYLYVYVCTVYSNLFVFVCVIGCLWMCVRCLIRQRIWCIRWDTLTERALLLWQGCIFKNIHPCGARCV